MRNPLVTALAVSALLVPAMQTPAQPADDSVSEERLSLRRIMLSTGGVGYFEYETQVSGDAALAFRVRRDQVDDVLKSVVVYDDEGRVGTIRLPGQEPLREAFRGLPFGPDDLASPVTLLNALRGAEVRLSGTREMSGRLLSVVPETTALPDSGHLTRHRVTLSSATGIQQALLEEVGALAFSDARLAAQVEAALAALARHDDPDSRTLTATLEGDGERTVRVAYVVEAPLWKATYRLTLPDDRAARTGAVQGWAVLENLSGEDWSGVELSVVSGNPVTFSQALYDAYYVDRPQVPVEVLGRVLPPADGGGVRVAAERGELRDEGLAGVAMPGTGPLDARALFSARPRDAVAASEAAPPALAGIDAAEAADVATQVIYRVPRPVTVASGESVLVPITAREIAVERLSLYQPGTHDRHPLASLRLTNDTGAGLPPGVLTLYERNAETNNVGYLGDARLATLPAGADRLLSFAVDYPVTIDRESQDAQVLERGRIVDGVLELTITERQETRYTIAVAADEDRHVLIEHPRRRGWALAGHAEVEMTDTAYRLPVSVSAGETLRFDAALERSRFQRIELAQLDVERIRLWAASGELAPEIRAALEELVAYRERLAAVDGLLRAAEQARDAILSDQQRLRENLSAVPADSDLSRRYLDALASQEGRLAELAGEIDALREARREGEEQLAAYVRALRL